MIALDTNVVSELMRPRPSAAVLEWTDARPASELAITAVTAAELRHGVARLPSGARHRRLSGQVEAMIVEDFARRVLPFTVEASAEFASLVATRERAGHPISTADAQIAAICRARGTALATRNTDDFADTGGELIDPWVTPTE